MKATCLTRITKCARTAADIESSILKSATLNRCVVAGLSIALLAAYPITVARTTQRNDMAPAAMPSHIPAETPAAQAHSRGVETLVLVRHAEKPPQGLGLLTCKGLNRALLLPDFFATNFDRPDLIIAPNPGVKVAEIHGDGKRYDYVRPLLTIGPTAIRLGVPINTQLPFNDPGLLADTLLDPQYHNDTIYVVWEHANLMDFANIMLRRFQDPSPVPPWPDSDFDTYYVFRIDWNKVPTLKFEVRSENLGPISEKCPEASKL